MAVTSTLALLALSSLAAPVPEAPALAWKFEKDKPFYHEITIDTHQTVKIKDQEVVEKQKQTFYLSYHPLRRQADAWILRMRVEGIKVEIGDAAKPVRFDSTRPGDEADPLTELYKALRDSEVLVTIGRAGKVLGLEGHAAFLKKVQRHDPQVKMLLDEVLTEASFKDMNDQLFNVLPDRNVVKGDTWKRSRDLDLGPMGRFVSTQEYIYDGKEGKLDRLNIGSVEFKFRPAEKRDAKEFAIQQAEFKTRKASGSILFDAAAGRVARLEAEMELEATLVAGLGDEGTTMELTETQKVTARVSDTNPLKK